MRGYSTNPEKLTRHIRAVLGAYDIRSGLDPVLGWHSSSAVLMLLGNCPDPVRHTTAPCLILNKRSAKVRQPGDLCFPGGGLSPTRDRLLARFLRLPWSPLKQWPFWPQWYRHHRNRVGTLSLALTIALREAWEEIHLNPLRVEFLGYLPLHHLRAFDRSIHPMVAAIGNNISFRPNWEVDRIVYIPLQKLLDKQNYARFRPMVAALDGAAAHPLHDDDFPCFIYLDDGGRELLWGATYRMVETFLKIVFGFEVPEMAQLPEVTGYLAPHYPQGANAAVAIPSRSRPA